jgi:hypothetical protein
MGTKQENTERKNIVKWGGKNEVQKIGGKEEGLKYWNSLAFLAL